MAPSHLRQLAAPPGRPGSVSVTSMASGLQQEQEQVRADSLLSPTAGHDEVAIPFRRRHGLLERWWNSLAGTGMRVTGVGVKQPQLSLDAPTKHLRIRAGTGVVEPAQPVSQCAQTKKPGQGFGVGDRVVASCCFLLVASRACDPPRTSCVGGRQVRG